MMNWSNDRYDVWLGPSRVGSLLRRHSAIWFVFSEEYVNDPQRAVLGLCFEDDLEAGHRGDRRGRLPAWFSNLLPEGRLRQWIDLQAAGEDELDLLAVVGHDLPGSVQVVEAGDSPEPELTGSERLALGTGAAFDEADPGLRFSLAGVQLKFSMVARDDRLTMPAHGEGGDWIVKLPDPNHDDVPLNEYAMMSLAEAAGIDVPERKLIEAEGLKNLPRHAWQTEERFAYAVRRFDRDEQRRTIHIEDLAQVRNFYPDYSQKYKGTYETIAAYIYRRRDIESLREFARRLAFNVLISNGDAHLKNWSLIYRDPRVPVLSPAYDLVSTSYYMGPGGLEDLGLKFGKTRRFTRVNVKQFERLERKLGAEGAELASVVAETVARTVEAWPWFAPMLNSNRELRDSVDQSIARHSKTLLATVISA